MQNYISNKLAFLIAFHFRQEISTSPITFLTWNKMFFIKIHQQSICWKSIQTHTANFSSKLDWKSLQRLWNVNYIIKIYITREAKLISLPSSIQLNWEGSYSTNVCRIPFFSGVDKALFSPPFCRFASFGSAYSGQSLLHLLFSTEWRSTFFTASA